VEAAHIENLATTLGSVIVIVDALSFLGAGRYSAVALSRRCCRSTSLGDSVRDRLDPKLRQV
jgi:hypothetical protein